MDWLYYQVYVDRYVDTQPVLARLADGCAQAGDLPWFYLRFLDATGLHLRLRWRGTAQELDRKALAVEDFLAPDGPGGALPVREVRVALYEPELGKWGAPAGVRAAEDVFAVSSTSCLVLLRQFGWTARPVVAAAAMTTAVRLLPEGSRLAFLRHYAWYWTAGPGGGGMAGPGAGVVSGRSVVATRARAAALAPRLRAPIADVGEPAPLVAYRDALTAQLDDHGPAAGGRTAPHLLFHQIHLTNNRLGIAPHQEAVLAEALVAAGPDEWGD